MAVKLVGNFVLNLSGDGVTPSVTVDLGHQNGFIAFAASQLSPFLNNNALPYLNGGPFTSFTSIDSLVIQGGDSKPRVITTTISGTKVTFTFTPPLCNFDIHNKCNQFVLQGAAFLNS